MLEPFSANATSNSVPFTIEEVFAVCISIEAPISFIIFTLIYPSNSDSEIVLSSFEIGGLTSIIVFWGTIISPILLPLLLKVSSTWVLEIVLNLYSLCTSLPLKALNDLFISVFSIKAIPDIPVTLKEISWDYKILLNDKANNITIKNILFIINTP